ncbi:Uncharacterised protein [Bordetella pertussis]|nr:Uncharacterised protein [Bordetella pertussis]CFW41428.1 Uncharacterised protein [Bordetella pertussis]
MRGPSISSVCTVKLASARRRASWACGWQIASM